MGPLDARVQGAASVTIASREAGPRRPSGRRAGPITAEGVWRPAPDAPACAVVVGLGAASLVIADPGGAVLAHWSLPAVERIAPAGPSAAVGPSAAIGPNAAIGPGATSNPPSDRAGAGVPARYAPGEDAAEWLEVLDAGMVAAIERARRGAAPPEPRRRGPVALAALLAAVALSLAGPAALRGLALRAVPNEVRTELGHAVLAGLGERAGPPCEGVNGLAALERLGERLAAGPSPDDAPPAARLALLRGGLAAPVALPGGIVVLPASTLEGASEPGVAAGHALAAAEEGALADPLDALLREGGPREALRLLTAAEVSARALDAFAARLAARPVDAPTAEAMPGLLARFEAAGVSSAPFGRAVGVPALVELDPAPDAPPVLPDAAWVALQGACGG